MEHKRLVFMGCEVDKVEDKDIRWMFKAAVELLYDSMERENKLAAENDKRFLKQIESKINC